MIIGVVILAFILRLININQSFWLDEAITATIARDYSLGHIISNYFPLDNSPSFYVFLINLIFSIFPNTEFIDRLPSLFAGVGTVYFVYLIGTKIVSRQLGLISALFLATSSLHIYYSQEGRMYAITAFFASVLIWFLISYFEHKKIKFLVGYTIFGILLLHTHYLSALMLAVSNLLAWRFKQFNSKWIIAQVIIGVSFLAWLPIFLKQFKLGVGGRGVSQVFDQVLGKFDPKTLPLTFEKFSLGRIPIGEEYPLVFIAIPLIVFAGVLLYGIWKSESKYKSVLLAWLGVPLFLATLISLKLPVFLHYRVLFTLPAFYLLLALSILVVHKRLRIPLIIFVLLVNILTTSAYYWDPKLQREQWKQAIDWVMPQINENDKVLFAGADPPAPYLWYRPSHPEAVGPFLGFYVAESSKAKVFSEIENMDRLFVFNYLQDITDPTRRLNAWIEEAGFKKVNEVSYIGVGKIEVYER